MCPARTLIIGIKRQQYKIRDWCIDIYKVDSLYPEQRSQSLRYLQSSINFFYNKFLSI